MLGSIVLAWTFAVGVLLLGARLKGIVGNNGLMACERLMGMVLVMLAIQRFAEGIQQFVEVPKLKKKNERNRKECKGAKTQRTQNAVYSTKFRI